MGNIFETFKEKVVSSVTNGDYQPGEDKDVNNLIALGVLLWEVAQADEKFLPNEEEEIKNVLLKFEDIKKEDMPIVLRAIQEASLEKIDLYSFTREVTKDLQREDKIFILENLFRVACVDQDLDEREHEIIRKIANLFRLDHKEFINSKVKVKKEFGMDTAGL